MALRLRRLVLGASTLPRGPAKHPNSFRHCVPANAVDNFRSVVAWDWSHSTVMMRKRVSLLPIASSSAVWSRPLDAIVHSASKFHSFGGRISAAASGKLSVTMDGDAGEVLDEGLGEHDEDVSAETLAAIREFDTVNEDLEAESQRSAEAGRSGRRPKSMCYYFTQGLCTLVRSVPCSSPS